MKQAILRSVLGCLLLSAIAVAQRPAPRSLQVVTEVKFHSGSLQRDMRYSVVLPPDYELSNRRYAVLYLLHGLYGNHTDWVTRTRLTQYAESYALIIVMPDAGDSWYTNSVSTAQDKFEDYILKDVIADVEGRYRTMRSAHGRAILGLSMGGYGAVKFALRRPDLFAVAGSLSGAFNGPLDADETPEYRDQLVRVFGERGSRTREDNDIFRLLPLNPTVLPYFYLSCGTADQFLQTNRRFVGALQAQKVAYEYHEMPGQHSWTYWDQHIRDFLAMLAEKLPLASPGSAR